MHAVLFLGCFLLAASQYLFGSAHMIPEEQLASNTVVVSNASSQSIESPSPPVLIVELPKSPRRNRKNKKQKKNKFAAKKHPPPPANCIPLWASCKSPNNVCCDFCAFCQCRLFRTVCFCRMGNPRC